MPDPTNRPPRLYKYEAFSERSLQNLKAQTIYFGSPKNFNDPYDCTLEPLIKPPSDFDVEFVRARYLKQKLPERVGKQMQQLSTEELRSMFVKSGKDTIEEAQRRFETLGVSCFSEVRDELLMWSHYGGKHKGFCLEFDTSHQPFEKIRQVRYSTAMPEIQIGTLLLNESYDTVIDLFSTKSASWSYEKEWRVLHANAETRFHYSAECLTGIYFGPEISSEALEIICLVLQGQNPNVKFWKGRRSKSEFKVEFDPFSYIPFSHLP